MNYPKELKYLSEITCIADYFLTGDMNRSEEEFTLNSCVKQFMDFAHTKELPKEANNAWSMVTKGREGVGVKEILAKSERFLLQDAMLFYNNMRTCILATKKLQELHISHGGDIFVLGNNLHVYCWKLQQIIDFREKIPKNMAIALLSFPDITSVTFEEIRHVMYANSREEYSPK